MCIFANEILNLLIIETGNLEVINLIELKIVQELLSVVDRSFLNDSDVECAVERRNKYEFTFLFLQTLLLVEHGHLVIKAAKKVSFKIRLDVHVGSQSVF